MTAPAQPGVAALRARLFTELTRMETRDDVTVRQQVVMTLASALCLVVFGDNPAVESMLRNAAYMTLTHVGNDAATAELDFKEYLTQGVIERLYADVVMVA